MAGWHKVQLKKNIHLKLRVFIVDEPKIDFVEPKRFTINLPSVGAPVAIRTEGDKVIILMRLTVRPRNDMVNIDVDISASGDGTPMPGFNENPTSEIGRYLGARIPT